MIWKNLQDQIKGDGERRIFRTYTHTHTHKGKTIETNKEKPTENLVIQIYFLLQKIIKTVVHVSSMDFFFSFEFSGVL